MPVKPINHLQKLPQPDDAWKEKKPKGQPKKVNPVRETIPCAFRFDAETRDILKKLPKGSQTAWVALAIKEKWKRDIRK